MKCKWQVEIDPYCQKVLAKHWPNVERHDDVRTFAAEYDERLHVDVICGGFPCQDISQNKPNAEGLAGARSGLWSEYLRIVRVLRPRFFVIENVSAFLFRGIGRVLCDIASSGYDAEWQTISASGFGAPHKRSRVFVVAKCPSVGFDADAIFKRSPQKTNGTKQQSRIRNWPGRIKSNGTRSNRIRWIPDSELCGVANGIPDKLDRYKGLGNSIVPQVAEYVGRLIIEAVNRELDTKGNHG